MLWTYLLTAIESIAEESVVTGAVESTDCVCTSCVCIAATVVGQTLVDIWKNKQNKLFTCYYIHTWKHCGNVELLPSKTCSESNIYNASGKILYWLYFKRNIFLICRPTKYRKSNTDTNDLLGRFTNHCKWIRFQRIQFYKCSRSCRLCSYKLRLYCSHRC